jgi:hypothetical protein
MMDKAMRSDPNNDGVRLKLKEIMTIMIAKHKVESRNEFIPSLLISYYRFFFFLLSQQNSTNKYAHWHQLRLGFLLSLHDL